MGQVIKPLYTPHYVPAGNEIAVFDTDQGTIRVRLDGLGAPITVGNFIELVQRGFYDNLNFYAKKQGDVVVGGCPITRPLRPQQVRMAVREQLRGIHPGMGDAGYVIEDEWTRNPNNHHTEGSLSLTHKTKPDSGSCQFFFSLADHPEYDDCFTVFGQIIEGLNVMKSLHIGSIINTISIEGGCAIPLKESWLEAESRTDKGSSFPSEVKAMEALNNLLTKKPTI
ncbi:MAG: peptidylprolyl isomerase [Mucinivorans sp.]